MSDINEGKTPDAPTAYRKTGTIPGGTSITGDGSVGRTLSGSGMGNLADAAEPKSYDNSEGTIRMTMGNGYLDKALDGSQGQPDRRLAGESSNEVVKNDKPFIESPLKLTDRGGL